MPIQAGDTMLTFKERSTTTTAAPTPDAGDPCSVVPKAEIEALGLGEPRDPRSADDRINNGCVEAAFFTGPPPMDEVTAFRDLVLAKMIAAVPEGGRHDAT